ALEPGNGSVKGLGILFSELIVTAGRFPRVTDAVGHLLTERTARIEHPASLFKHANGSAQAALKLRENGSLGLQVDVSAHILGHSVACSGRTLDDGNSFDRIEVDW